MARHGPWFPPEFPSNTGAFALRVRLPRRFPDFDALCRPPTPCPLQHRSGSPCSGPTSMRALCSLPQGADDTCARHVPCVGDGSPALRHAGMVEERRRAPRLRDRPLRTCHGRTTRRRHLPPCQKIRIRGVLWLQVQQDPRLREDLEVSGRMPHGPHVRTPTPRPTTFLGSSQGLLPAQAGSPLAGRVLHPLDDKRSFMKLSPFTPLRPALPWSH